MQKILIATTNPGKLAEIRLFLSGLEAEFVSPGDVGVEGQPEETGKTFAENAELKARWYAEKTGLPVVADDGGFEIDALGGEPGVHSHRWIHGDREDTDDEIIAYTIERMKDVPDGSRSARLRVVIVFAVGDRIVASATGSVEGVIPSSPSGKLTPGFPYRSLLYLPEIGKFYDHAALTDVETVRYNHRKHVLDELRPAIADYLAGTYNR